MVFSADHMNDPARISAMCEEGFLSEGRRDDLLHFPWHHDVIFHEAGIPPIHTPMQTLQVKTHENTERNASCYSVFTHPPLLLGMRWGSIVVTQLGAPSNTGVMPLLCLILRGRINRVGSVTSVQLSWSMAYSTKSCLPCYI